MENDSWVNGSQGRRLHADDKARQCCEAQSIAFDMTSAERCGMDGVMSCEDLVTHHESAEERDKMLCVRVIVMRRLIFLNLLVLTSITSLAEEMKCDSGGNQLQMNACARDDFAKADKELNQIYQSLIKKEADDPLFVRKLRIAQKSWLAFRDADLESVFACSDNDVRICWGSMYPMSFLSRKAELTRERAKNLQRILKDGRG